MIGSNTLYGFTSEPRQTLVNFSRKMVQFTSDQPQAIIIDNGTSKVTAGFETHQSPFYIEPTIVSRTSDQSFIGEDCFHQQHSPCTHPIQRGRIVNFDDMELVWQHVFDGLRTNPSDHSILLSESMNGTESDREKMAEIMFERFTTPRMTIVQQVVMSYMITNRDNVLIVESGDSLTQIAPFIDGNLIREGMTSLELGGCDVTDYLSKLLVENELDKRQIQEIKEKIGKIAYSYEEIQSASMESYELPDGQVILIGQEAIHCGEVLFKPSLIDSTSPSIPETIVKTLQKGYNIGCVYLSGGNSMLDGFSQRVQTEVCNMDATQVNFRTEPYRKTSVWLGGEILASLSMSKPCWVTRQEYEESGSCIVRQKMNYLTDFSKDLLDKPGPLFGVKSMGINRLGFRI